MTEVAVDAALFAKLIPLNGLKRESQGDLIKKSRILDVKAGSTVFKIGDQATDALFLLAGEAQLEDAAGQVLSRLKAGEPAAQHRIAHQTPRKVTLKVSTDAKFLAVEASLLDVMLTWDQTGSFEVQELQSDDGDWMSKLLQMPTFQRVPPSNLQGMFMRMQEMAMEPGKVIVKQNEDGDFFYVIMQGRVMVTREMPNAKAVKLAELDHGACFGEEALISDTKRNATVTAMSKGKLMRLSKQDFRSLLTEPLSRKLAFADAKKMVDAGEAKWLDVRLPSEAQALPLLGALNIPLYMLRMKLAAVDTKTKWIVACDTGRRSSVGVFVLTQKGYDAYLLDKGLPPPT